MGCPALVSGRTAGVIFWRLGVVGGTRTRTRWRGLEDLRRYGAANFTVGDLVASKMVIVPLH